MADEGKCKVIVVLVFFSSQKWYPHDGYEFKVFMNLENQLKKHPNDDSFEKLYVHLDEWPFSKVFIKLSVHQRCLSKGAFACFQNIDQNNQSEVFLKTYASLQLHWLFE